MKRTVITYKSGATAIKLEPDDGFAYLTNGMTNSRMVVVQNDTLAAIWHDTNDEPPMPPDPEEEPTVEDKAEAYDILTGVSE